MKSIFRHKYKFEIVTSKEGFDWLESTDKICRSCTKKCVHDLGTFVGNEGYHCDEESVLSILVSRLTAKTHRRMAVASTATNSGDWTVKELGPTISGPLKLVDRHMWPQQLPLKSIVIAVVGLGEGERTRERGWEDEREGMP